jgi:hypothetical protein
LVPEKTGPMEPPQKFGRHWATQCDELLNPSTAAAAFVNAPRRKRLTETYLCQPSHGLALFRLGGP